jgi:ribose transport system substrate-binding protein
MPSDRRVPPRTPQRGRSRLALTALALIALVLLVTGCGNKTTASSSTSSSASSSTSSAGGTDLAIGRIGTKSQMLTSIDSVCGSKPTVVGLAWGFDGNDWRKLTHGMVEQYAKTCPSVKKFLYANANLNAQKSISDINSMVAQGVNVLLVYPDVGPAVLPAMRAAMAKGVKVVPFVVESKAST